MKDLLGKIVVYDSGVGGMTVLEALKKVFFLQQEFFYFADVDFFPYGTKSKEFLEQRARFLFDDFFSRGALAVVVACHTLSTQISNRFIGQKQTIFWTVNGSLRALKNATSPIALIATLGTINSLYYQKALQTQGSLFSVHAASGLIAAIEAKDPNLEDHLQKFLLEEGICEGTTLFWGSTHLAHLTPFFRRSFATYSICDPTEVIAQSVLEELQIAFGPKERWVVPLAQNGSSV